MEAVFIDRDGVVNELIYYEEHGIIDSPFVPGQFRLLPGAADAIRQLREAGYSVVMVSNQPGIAKKHMSAESFDEIRKKMRNQLAAEGAFLDGEYTVFGQVVDGLDVLDKIATTPTGPGDDPATPQVLNKVTIEQTG